MKKILLFVIVEKSLEISLEISCSELSVLSK